MKQNQFNIASFTAFKDSYKKDVIQNNIGKTMYEIDAILEEMYIAYINRELNANVCTLKDALRIRKNAQRRESYNMYGSSQKYKSNARNRAYYAANKEKIVADRKEYYAANKDKLVAYQREYYAANKDKLVAQKKEYYAANKDKIATKLRRRKKDEKNY